MNSIKLPSLDITRVPPALAILIALVCVHSHQLRAEQPGSDAADHQATAATHKALPARSSKDGRFRVRFKNGTVIELLGIGEHPAINGHWWDADGSVLSAPPVENGKYALMNRPRIDVVERREPQDYLRQFIVRATTSDKTATLTCRCLDAWHHVHGQGVDVIGGQLQINDHFAAAIERLPTGAIRSIDRADGSISTRTADTLVEIDAEFCSGPWETAAACGINASVSGPFEGGEFAFGFAGEIDGKAGISVSHTSPKNDLDMRLVAVDQDGKERTLQKGNHSRPTSESHLGVLIAVFGVPLANVKEFRFQTRPLHRIEFRNVAIAPRPEGADNRTELPVSARFHILVDGKPWIERTPG